mgnify:FL=1
MKKLWAWIKSIFHKQPVQPEPTPEPTPIPPAPTPIPMPGKVPLVVCKESSWFNDFDKQVLKDAVAGLNHIFSTKQFQTELMSRTYTEDFGEGGAGIWKRMVAGDQLSPEDDLGELDFKIVMYNSPWSRVVGYTYLESIVINVNRKFFATPSSVASNIAHELMHTLGYTHDDGFDDSVPYQMNEIIDVLWEQLNLG